LHGSSKPVAELGAQLLYANINVERFIDPFNEASTPLLLLQNFLNYRISAFGARHSVERLGIEIHL
jgi:hypothetical protein